MKKVLLCSLCLLVCALGINIPAVAQPSQKLVNVVAVSYTHLTLPTILLV